MIRLAVAALVLVLAPVAAGGSPVTAHCDAAGALVAYSDGGYWGYYELVVAADGRACYGNRRFDPECWWSDFPVPPPLLASLKASLAALGRAHLGPPPARSHMQDISTWVLAFGAKTIPQRTLVGRRNQGYPDTAAGKEALRKTRAALTRILKRARRPGCTRPAPTA